MFSCAIAVGGGLWKGYTAVDSYYQKRTDNQLQNCKDSLNTQHATEYRSLIDRYNDLTNDVKRLQKDQSLVSDTIPSIKEMIGLKLDTRKAVIDKLTSNNESAYQQLDGFLRSPQLDMPDAPQLLKELDTSYKNYAVAANQLDGTFEDFHKSFQDSLDSTRKWIQADAEASSHDLDQGAERPRQYSKKVKRGHWHPNNTVASRCRPRKRG